MESNKDELIKIYREIQVSTNSYIDNQIELLKVEETPLIVSEYQAKIEQLTKDKKELETKIMFLEKEVERLKNDPGILDVWKQRWNEITQTPQLNSHVITSMNNRSLTDYEMSDLFNKVDNDAWTKINEKLKE